MTAKRDFLSLQDLTIEDARQIFELAGRLKAQAKGGHLDLLRGRAVAIVMEKASTRTRVSFEVGIAQLGAHPVVFGVEGSQLARGEPIKDTARVLSRYVDAIVYRTSARARLDEMAGAATVPVINALTDDGHPVQVLADVFTAEECFRRERGEGHVEGRRFVFFGDCTSNMARSWIHAAPLFGLDLVLCAPPGYWPAQEDVLAASPFVTTRSHPTHAFANADVVSTDVWTSMGQEAETERRRRDFQGFTLNAQLLARAREHAIVLHCLPAHRGEEIDEETLEGPRSRVWDQAENRLHVQKGLLCWLLGVDVPGTPSPPPLHP